MTNNEIKKKKIVLIEDEEILSNLLVQKLSKIGFEIKAAADGESGYNLIESESPDLLLLDMMLPKMNGFQILEKLVETKRLPQLPVVIISNSGQPVEIDKALKMGVRDYLIKVNFNPEEVIQKINDVFNSSAAAPLESPFAENSGAADTTHNVLIVEDDVFMAGLLERKFKQEKFSIYKAASAAAARETLAKTKIDIMLLDVVLPGLDGFAFLKELKADQKLKNIPVIITSNLGQQEEIDRGMSEGAADYIVKAHASPTEIVEKVKKIVT